MPTTIVKLVLPLLLLSISIPESEAKRMGGGRSAGRQAQGIGKSATQPPSRPVQPQGSNPIPRETTAPPAARQAAPDNRVARQQSVPQAPPAPTSPQSLPRQAASPWGGMLGGALLGLGLGSLMSGNGNAADRQNQPAESSGGSAAGTSGASGDYANPPAQTQAAAEQQTSGGLRSILPIGLLALIIYFAVRRMRRTRR